MLDRREARPTEHGHGRSDEVCHPVASTDLTENGQAEGIAMARDFLARVAQRVQGTYLTPSFGRYEVVSEVIRGLPGR